MPEGRFREMTPHGCQQLLLRRRLGLRHHVAATTSATGATTCSGRRKFRQILEAFQDEPMDQEHPKYICAPCSNCKGQLRDIIEYYDAWEKARHLLRRAWWS